MRPTKYDKSIIDKAIKYLSSCKDQVKDKRLIVNLPSIEGLSLYIKVHKDTIYEWEKIYPEFSDVISELRAEQAIRLLNSGLSGAYNPMIAKALLSKHGYSEKQELDINAEIPLQITRKIVK